MEDDYYDIYAHDKSIYIRFWIYTSEVELFGVYIYSERVMMELIAWDYFIWLRQKVGNVINTM